MRGIPWSAEEIRVLRKVYPAYRRGEIDRTTLVALFPARRFTTIIRRASILGIGADVRGTVDPAALSAVRARGIAV